MDSWLAELDRLLVAQQAVVLVTVASVKGSTPREPGARMLVSEQQVFSTIGGGHLEYKAIQIARNMLADDSTQLLQRFSLGAGLGQCCGGVVNLMFECVRERQPWVDELIEQQAQGRACVQVIPLSSQSAQPRIIVAEDMHDDSPISRFALQLLQSQGGCQIKSFAQAGDVEQSWLFDPVVVDDFRVYVFGAGHVGRALVEQLSLQEIAVTWVDTRDNQFPQTLMQHVEVCCTDTPESVIDAAAAGSYFVIMTHDHQLDQQLCEQILRRGDFDYLGLIGSHSKRSKFDQRLMRRGIDPLILKRMTCPIGIAGINSKKPAAIALAVCAQIVQLQQAAVAEKSEPVQNSRRSIKL